MFSGSSCTQTISSALRIAVDASREHLVDGQRDTAARRGRSATCGLSSRGAGSSAGRRRPCRCRRSARRTSAARAAASRSSITFIQRPSARSRGDEATNGWRSRLFGVSTTSGSGSFTSSARLAPQQVEVLRRRRAVRDAHVDVGGQLQEPFRPRARVVRPLAFVAVRQQQHERRLLPPLGAGRQHELVEDQSARR